MNGDPGSRPPSASSGEEEVARLLRLAGPPPALREAEVAPVREAARAAWRRQVDRRQARRNRLWVGGALAATLLLVSGLALRTVGLSRSSGPVATLELEAGAVTVQRVPGRGGLAGELGAGSHLTTGSDGRAALRMTDGTSVRLDAHSRIRLVSSSALALESGAVYVDTGPLPGSGVDTGPLPGSGVETARPAASKLAIETALGEVTHFGTQFEVRLVATEPTAGEALQVRVREGEVRIATSGDLHEVAAGSELTVSRDGGLRRGAVQPHDEAWGWAVRASPAPVIEGTTLASFLDWTARELGVRWRVSGTLPAPPPEAIVLHGSVAGLSPEQALEVVLTGSGLRARREGGELLVSIAGD